MKLLLVAKPILPLQYSHPWQFPLSLKVKWVLLDEEGFTTGNSRPSPRRNIVLLLSSPLE